jgi:WhiB family redox-sensing transcriptional regulator
VGKSNFTDAELAVHGRLWLAMLDALDALEAEGETILCKQAPDLWFPEGNGHAVFQALKEARAGCMPCKLRDKCATYAIVSDAREGMWGGTTPIERKNIRKELVRNGEIDRVAEFGYLAYRRERLQASGRAT